MVTAETLKYMFSIRAGFPTRWVAKTPAGYRIDAEFHPNQSAPGVYVAPEPYWVSWGEEVRKWLHSPGQNVLAAWKDRFDKNAKGKALVELLEKELSGSREHIRAHLAKEADQYPELADLLKELRQDVRDEKCDCPVWLGIDGNIVSGMDWALLRADGVIDFDGQWVLTDGKLDDKEAVLVNARTLGSVDLCRGDQPRPYTLDHAVAMVRAIPDNQTVGIALAIKFEAPQEPEPWASKKYTRRKGQLRYVRLSRGQFIARGELASFGTNAAKLDLNVYQVQV